MAIRIGGVDVLGGVWSDWYPDDLPRDWRLDYYANEFSVMLFSPLSFRGGWALGVSEVDTLEWPEHLQVIVAWDETCLGGEVFERFCAHVRDNGLTVASWVYLPGSADSPPQMGGRLKGGAQLAVPSETLMASGVTMLWSAGEGSARVLYLYASPEASLRDLREAFEGLSPELQGEEMVILQADPKVLGDVRLMLEMIGVA
ncbi:MAG: hypothetical protein ACWA5X_09585 [bacterium]